MTYANEHGNDAIPDNANDFLFYPFPTQARKSVAREYGQMNRSASFRRLKTLIIGRRIGALIFASSLLNHSIQLKDFL